MREQVDFCRTIKRFDRARRGRNKILPSQKLITRLQKLHKTWDNIVLSFKKVFEYRPTKGWLVGRRVR